jgi:hypothetical protein
MVSQMASRPTSRTSAPFIENLFEINWNRADRPRSGTFGRYG